MSYSQPVMNKFANAIANKINCQIQTGMHKIWPDHTEEVNRLREEFNKKQNIQSLLFFIKAIANARLYTEMPNKYPSLLDKEERKENIAWLDNNFDECIKQFKVLQKKDARLTDIKIPVNMQAINTTTQITEEPNTKPQPVTTHSSSTSTLGIFKNIGTTLFDGIATTWGNLDNVARDEKVTEFINTKEFKNLKHYQENVLTDDTRSHWFFNIDLTVNKAPLLKEFITNIENSQNMKQVKGHITKFYSGMGTENSNYDILNRGQNITTRFFNLFGMQSTTVGLINEISKPFMEEFLAQQAGLKQ